MCGVKGWKSEIKLQKNALGDRWSGDVSLCFELSGVLYAVPCESVKM